ncbi:uncharacterized protein LOC134235162 isoform X2 [Saccostrea cucullata]|uniref:uncharacterized protein LOC134235162 isoform X2 n=1 Tax=Saccostrea cuccullata TaxID=36930 RepID=UPI002ECFC0E7
MNKRKEKTRARMKRVKLWRQILRILSFIGRMVMTTPIRHRDRVQQIVLKLIQISLQNIDEAEHKRHHEFIRSPEKMYADNYLKYCFGAKYIEPEDFEYLQQILGERICVNKFLPGSIFSRYSSFKNLDNEELEKIFIDSPLMGHEYFKFVILKEAVTYLVCCNTGLPYEESDERCSQTEASVAQHKRVQEGCFPFNL